MDDRQYTIASSWLQWQSGSPAAMGWRDRTNMRAVSKLVESGVLAVASGQDWKSLRHKPSTGLYLTDDGRKTVLAEQARLAGGA